MDSGAAGAARGTLGASNALAAAMQKRCLIIVLTSEGQSLQHGLGLLLSLCGGLVSYSTLASSELELKKQLKRDATRH